MEGGTGAGLISPPKRPACPASPPSGRRAKRWTMSARPARSPLSTRRHQNGGDVAKALALGADAVAIGHAALMALNCNRTFRKRITRSEMGVEAGYCYHCHRPMPGEINDAGSDPASARSGRSPRACSIPSHAGDRVPDDGARLWQTNVHSLEPGDLAALTMEASALAMVPLAGTPAHRRRADMTRALTYMVRR